MKRSKREGREKNSTPNRNGAQHPQHTRRNLKKRGFQLKFVMIFDRMIYFIMRYEGRSSIYDGDYSSS